MSVRPPQRLDVDLDDRHGVEGDSFFPARPPLRDTVVAGGRVLSPQSPGMTHGVPQKPLFCPLWDRESRLRVGGLPVRSMFEHGIQDAQELMHTSY